MGIILIFLVIRCIYECCFEDTKGLNVSITFTSKELNYKQKPLVSEPTVP